MYSGAVSFTHNNLPCLQSSSKYPCNNRSNGIDQNIMQAQRSIVNFMKRGHYFTSAGYVGFIGYVIAQCELKCHI